MATTSNLYATKVFAEHPIVLWSLDDQCDYISLITESQRDFTTGWTVSNASSTTLTINKPSNFADSTTEIYQNNVGQSQSLFTRSNLFTSSNLNIDANTFSVGFYFYYFVQNISSIRIGYQIDSGSYTYSSGKNPVAGEWSFISNTFTFPNGFFDGTVKNISIKIEINFNTTAQTPFAINGLTIGQQAEEFHSYSLGITPQLLPTQIPIYSEYGVVANAYGANVNNGYYIVNNNKILAKNNSIPLVYGASNLTALSSNTKEDPSLILPASGFLNKLGQFRTYTLESWIRINAYTFSPQKILGPIASGDGLYVDGPFLTLKIDQYSITHYVGEWYRPMLIHICYSPTTISLLVNGEKVGSINIDSENISLPQSSYVNDENETIDQDWIGFYCSSSVPQIELDCVGLYPYQIPLKVAKRRWVYGQGVDFPNNINTAYSGKSVYIDYPFAKYSKNYLYPDIGKWNQAILENISPNKQYISPKKYSLPKVIFQNQPVEMESAWFEDLKTHVLDTGAGITLTPSSSWKNIPGYLYFDKLNVIDENVAAIYGVFKINPRSTSTKSSEILMKIQNKLTNEYLSIEVSGTEALGFKISYILNSAATNNTDTVLYSDDLSITTAPLDSGSADFCYAGIKFDIFQNTYEYNLHKFFGNRESLALFIAGDSNFNKSFDGYIYRVGFCTSRNFSKISTLFDSNGIVKQDNDIFGTTIYDGGTKEEPTDSLIGGNAYTTFSSPFFDHIATYTLYPKMNYDSFIIDIATDSYWEDYVPLSYFGKSVLNAGNLEFSLDMLQFNIDFPKPIQKYIDNVNKYETGNSIVKTYVSFQDLTLSPFSFKKSFANTSAITSQNQTITPGAEYTTTRYEVVNGTIINIPSNIFTDFTKFGLVIHIEMIVDGIFTKPIKIKKMQIAGNAFGSDSATEIGTRFGISLFPYKKESNVYKYDQYSSFQISKFTKPYLYLTRDTGIMPLTSNTDRGLSLQINEEQLNDFALSSLQISMRIERFDFESSSKQLFELDTLHMKIQIMLTKLENGRGIISYTFTSDIGLPDPKLVFYINGHYVANPIININQWIVLGIGFINSVDFSSSKGNFNITYPVLVNNISYFQETVLQKIVAGANRQWFGVKYGSDASPGDDANIFEWEDWKNKESVVVTAANISGSNIVYSYTVASKTVLPGEYVSVIGFSPSGFNVVNALVTASGSGTFTVAKPAGVSGSATIPTSATAYTYSWNDVLILSPSQYFGADLETLYNSYTGTNKITASDNINLFINRYQYSIYQDVIKTSQTITPV